MEFEVEDKCWRQAVLYFSLISVEVGLSDQLLCVIEESVYSLAAQLLAICITKNASCKL